MKTIGTNAQAITTHDTNYFSKKGCVYVGTTGHVNVLPIDAADTNTAGNGIIFKNVPAGTTLPIVVKKVFSTSTTATDMVLITEM